MKALGAAYTLVAILLTTGCLVLLLVEESSRQDCVHSPTSTAFCRYVMSRAINASLFAGQ